jgi:hypothetical protein
MYRPLELLVREVNIFSSSVSAILRIYIVTKIRFSYAKRYRDVSRLKYYFILL